MDSIYAIVLSVYHMPSRKIQKAKDMEALLVRAFTSCLYILFYFCVLCSFGAKVTLISHRLGMMFEMVTKYQCGYFSCKSTSRICLVR